EEQVQLEPRAHLQLVVAVDPHAAEADVDGALAVVLPPQTPQERDADRPVEHRRLQPAELAPLVVLWVGDHCREARSITGNVQVPGSVSRSGSTRRPTCTGRR